MPNACSKLGTRVGLVYHDVVMKDNDCSYFGFNSFCYERARESKRELVADLSLFGLLPYCIRMGKYGLIYFFLSV